MPQHIWPCGQSATGSSHCQSVSAASHGVPDGSQVDDPDFGSQQCWVCASQYSFLPPSTALKGQKIEGEPAFGGCSDVGEWQLDELVVEPVPPAPEVVVVVLVVDPVPPCPVVLVVPVPPAPGVVVDVPGADPPPAGLVVAAPPLPPVVSPP